MIWLVLLTIVLSLFFYNAVRAYNFFSLFFKCNKPLFVLLYYIPSISFFVLALTHKGSFLDVVYYILGLWMGINLNFLFANVLIDLFKIFSSLFKKENYKKIFESKSAGVSVLAFCLLLLVFESYSARTVNVVNYDIAVSGKKTELNSLKIVMLSDIHLGSVIGAGRMNKIVDEINAQCPDLVLISGDIFDTNFRALKSPDDTRSAFKRIMSKYGVYACFGNHDVDVTMSEVRNFLQSCGVELLEDEVRSVNGIYIAGRKDKRPIGVYNPVRKDLTEVLFGIDHAKPVIVLDHQPSGVQEASSVGVDLLLCGHTHKGQLFPGNFITDFVFPVDYGCEIFGNTNVVVSSGVGTWGPELRLGSFSEIVVLNVSFE